MSESFCDRIDEFGPGDEEEFLTIVQWSHEEGGFEIPVQNLPPNLELPAPFERVEVFHTGGKEEAWLVQSLDLAVIDVRERLEQKDGRSSIVIPPGSAKVGENGVYTRKQAICVCKQLVEAGVLDIVVLTAKSTVSAQLGRALRAAAEFRKAANWAASEKAGRRVTFPKWAFFIPLYAGPTERSEQGGKITPLCHAVPSQPTHDDFNERMVSSEVREFIRASLSQVEQWKADATFYGAGQVFGASNVPPSPQQPAAPAADPGAQRRIAQARRRIQKTKGDSHQEARRNALAIAAPCGTQGNPEFRGQTLGDLLSSAAGRAFVRYLGGEYRPRTEAGQEAKQAAKALVTAGLTR